MYEYGPGQHLVASVDLPVTGQFTQADPEQPALGFGLMLEPSAIADLLFQAGPGDTPRTSGARRLGSPSATLRLRCSTRWSGAAALARRAPRPGRTGPLAQREILWRLITGEQGATVRQLGLADSSLSHVSRAVRWIREHYAQPFRVEDVARLSGMNVSAFYRNFQAVTAMSPNRFQKQIRLQEARLLLATHPGDVTGVGHRVGYDNPSQFSREYRRQFGAPSSQDAARLRQAVRTSAGVLPRVGWTRRRIVQGVARIVLRFPQVTAVQWDHRFSRGAGKCLTARGSHPTARVTA